jgi:hypothetical protein
MTKSSDPTRGFVVSNDLPSPEQLESVPTSDADLPDWARNRKQPRDPESGFLWPRRCELYLAGHTLHYIPATRSVREPHRTGYLIAANGNVISVDFGDEVKRYRHHAVERLVEIVGIGGKVQVCEGFGILRFPHGGGNFCFSVKEIDKPWIPCDDTPPTSTSPEALAERLNTHGGFLVPGSLSNSSEA